MSYKPSKRVKGGMEEDELHLNLNPMMDMFAVLIPALLMMSAVVEVSSLNVASPAIDPDAANKPPPQNDKPPLNLTVTILDSGYVLLANGAPLGGGDPAHANIPLTDVATLCSRYRGTRPPPREKNADRPICGEKEGNMQKPFLVYDTTTLTQKVIELKNENPDERKVTIQPGPGSEYEAIIDVMDSTRDIKEASGEVRVLFDEVLISPGLL